MNMRYILFVFSVFACFFVCHAGFKEPGWKHCIISLHALPSEWGRVTSPGFPNGINKQIQCSWVISSNPGFRIKLALQTLNMTGSIKSCYTQFVEVLDYKTGTSVGKFCGARRPGDYVSHGTRVRFDLQGDTSGEKTKGFELRFKATKEPPGFKTTWAFPNTKKPPPKSKKPPPKRKPTRTRPRLPKPAASRSPPKRPTRPSVATAAPKGPATEKPARSPPPRTAPSRAPPPRTPPKRIMEARPRPQPNLPGNPNRPIYYGENSVRGIDHGSSKVITETKEDAEPELNLYLIIGVAAGGVVALIIIFVIMKICVFDKSKNRRKKEKEEAEKAKNEAADNFRMSVLPGAVPEQYMSEQIVQQPFHHLQPMPMMSSMSHQRPYPGVPGPYPHAGSKSRTLPPAMTSTMPRGTRSTRSRARSSRSRVVSRRPEMQRSRSRNSVRGSRSRASLRRSKSKSLQYIPQMDGQWVMVDQRHHADAGVLPSYPMQGAPDSSDITSSEWETETSSSDESYIPKKNRYANKRTHSIPRMKSQPPPYDAVASQTMPYYVIDKSREYDEGYDTGRRTTGTKSVASKRREEKRKPRRRASEWENKKRKKSRRKYSQ